MATVGGHLDDLHWGLLLRDPGNLRHVIPTNHERPDVLFSGGQFFSCICIRGNGGGNLCVDAQCVVIDTRVLVGLEGEDTCGTQFLFSLGRLFTADC
jgi:hypothetical protein